MGVCFHPEWFKSSLLCLFIFILAAPQTVKTAEAEKDGENMAHRHRRGGGTKKCENDDYIAACVSACTIEKCDQAADGVGIPSCECPKGRKFPAPFGCNPVDGALAMPPKNSEDRTAGTCAFKCQELTTASEDKAYSATFCRAVVINNPDETSDTFQIPVYSVCTCSPSLKSAGSAQMEQTTADIRGIILALVQALMNSITSTVEAVKNLMQTLASLNLGGIVSGLKSLAGVLGSSR